MAKTYKYCLSPSPSELLQKAMELAKDQKGIQFEGNEESGSVKGMGFSGEYLARTAGGCTEVIITVLKKPLIVSWARIQSELDSTLEPFLADV